MGQLGLPLRPTQVWQLRPSESREFVDKNHFSITQCQQSIRLFYAFLDFLHFAYLICLFQLIQSHYVLESGSHESECYGVAKHVPYI